ncbi:hydroxypyruvate isomerase family protein [Dokdonia donghaensis]|uniref:Xylose isomerase n=1 Tax=Dokdonia donghaensis DSW-1 TaxID=1300343 RepID=A0A0A2GWT4_9FLAO|nr:TIM barrel protein [Dokdonia donghaensis]ANH59640.1 Hydroxypyruvate isomerase [Dokdonia donghaensis DSW-1]KGO06998.1 xylose isomerase [Dokdonia donghaensis DSW-1]
MERRKFIQKGALTGSFLGLGIAGIHAMNNVVRDSAFAKADTEPHTFNLNYAPHIGMFKELAGENVINQLNFMADQGFTAFEDNEMRSRPIAEQEAMAEVMRRRGLTMGVFVAHKIHWTKPNLASGNQEWRDEFLADIKSSIEVAKRVNAKWMTVVPGHVDLRQNIDFQTANVVESLRQASALLEPHGIVMVLEPLNFRNHPGLFLSKSPQAYQICKAVNSPSCKILFDIYHQQIQEGNLIPNIEQCWDEIAYFQIGDNPGRNEPTSGEINYKNVFKYIHSRGFKGVLGMEHGNSIEGKEGEQRVIDAYVESDRFL